MDLVHEHDYLCQNASLDVADEYIAGLLESGQRIGQFPNLGRSEPWVARSLKADLGQVRSFLYRNHRCYYLLRDESEVYILGYIHTKRERSNALRERLTRIRNQNPLA